MLKKNDLVEIIGTPECNQNSYTTQAGSVKVADLIGYQVSVISANKDKAAVLVPLNPVGLACILLPLDAVKLVAKGDPKALFQAFA